MLQNPKPLAVVAFSLSGSNFCLPFAPITVGSLFQKQCCYYMTDMRKKITSIYFEMIRRSLVATMYADAGCPIFRGAFFEQKINFVVSFLVNHK